MTTYRNKILELFDEGFVGKDELFLNLLNWISESDAYEFWEQYYDDGESYLDRPDESRAWYDTSAELL